MKPTIEKIYQKEDSLSEYPEAITADEVSPTRFDIPMNIIKTVEAGKKNNLMNYSTILPMISNIRNINRSIESLKRNDGGRKENINEDFFQNLENFSRKQGVANIGYTKLPRHLMFEDKAVLFENAIVMTMEMDKDLIAMAPHRKTVKMIMKTYDRLGKAGNKVATYLRYNGYNAQASHPLGGLVLYPPLAHSAGLGWFGRHGLLITPEFGSRVRLGAVFTDIPNLPYASENNHGWIGEYCSKCGICIRNCPPKAIMEKSIQSTNGLKTHIESDKCFQNFVQNYGCTICVKVCPFSFTNYDKLHNIVLKRTNIN